MASRFWVGGAGSWDTTTTAHWAASSGGATGASAPTSADDVFFDANSGTGNAALAATVSIKSLDCTGYTGTLTGTGFSILINGTVCKFVAGMTLTGATVSPNGNGITTAFTCAGKTLASMFIQNGATLSQQDTLNVSGTLTLTQGTWLTNNFASSLGLFASSNANVRTITPGSSGIGVSGGGTAWNVAIGTNMVITPNTATITLSGAGAIINHGPSDFKGASIVMNGSGVQQFQGSGITCANLTRTGTAVKTDGLTTSVNLTCTGTLTLNSNSDINRLIVQSATAGVARTITAASVVITNTVDFTDITGAGAATWTVAGTGATALGDAGGNSGITFTTPATQTHTASAGGNWSDVTKWTSRVPLPQDNVIVDGNTTGTISEDMPRFGANIDFTSFSGTFSRAINGLTSYGSWTNSSTMTTTGTVLQNFAGRGNHTLTSAGVAFPSTGGIFFNGPGGTYTLQDDLSSGGTVQITNGTLDTNATGNYNITALLFVALTSSGSIFNGNNSTVYITQVATGIVFSFTSGAVANMANTTVVIQNASAVSRTIQFGGRVMAALTYTVANSPGQLIITGGNTFNTVNVLSGKQIQWPSSTTNIVTNWNVKGSPNGYLYLPGVSGNHASTPDSPAVSITGDIDVRARVAFDNWAGAAGTLFAKVDNFTTLTSYQFEIQPNGFVRFLMSNNGAAWTKIYAANAALSGLVNGSDTWIRATRVSSTGSCTFYQSSNGTIWTQIGSVITGPTGGIFASTANLVVGATNAGTGTLAVGKFYRAQIRNNVLDDGTGIVFDADFTTKTVGANTFAESSSNAAVVTINGATAQVGDGRVALSASAAGTAATLSFLRQAVSDYITVQDNTATTSVPAYAGANSVLISNANNWLATVPPTSGFFNFF